METFLMSSDEISVDRTLLNIVHCKMLLEKDLLLKRKYAKNKQKP